MFLKMIVLCQTQIHLPMVPDQLRAKLRMTCIPVISVVFVIFKNEGSTEIYKECNFEQKLFIEEKYYCILLKSFVRQKPIHLAEVSKVNYVEYYYLVLTNASFQGSRAWLTKPIF